MKLIAQTIPGLKDIFGCNPINQTNCPPNQGIQRIPGAQDFPNLASFLSGLLNIVFYIVVFLAFYYLVWGAFQYILAQGKKEELAKARARITWALVGLIIVFLAFLIAKYAATIFPPTKGGLPF